MKKTLLCALCCLMVIFALGACAGKKVPKEPISIMEPTQALFDGLDNMEAHEDEEEDEEESAEVAKLSAAAELSAAVESSAAPEHGVSNSELIDYFCEVALNVEYNSTDNHLKRWEDPLRVKIMGDYTNEDYETLEYHIDALNSLGVLPDISIVSSGENFQIYFVLLDEMDDVIPGYVEDNWGYFYLYWDGDYHITDAYMGIATDVTTQEARNHLILEEFTQALGLMSDSYDYEDSIFQSQWTETQSLASIDVELVRMLYSGYLKVGMEEYEVRSILNNRLEDILQAAD